MLPTVLFKNYSSTAENTKSLSIVSHPFENLEGMVYVAQILAWHHSFCILGDDLYLLFDPSIVGGKISKSDSLSNFFKGSIRTTFRHGKHANGEFQ